ncbi:MAG: hypothetical protein A2Z91_01160 [Deltaproteobacteria bacterium GWA2_38_16]|nr:MAG: hypothetical protein A2Z91_01160 [Deltaproteobacteria bacterium GWA2_38_16]OGQ02949.1 MAG: hypothetical protein A3D19_00870 [Deltaproteobacteria bacterium RIFCSPHIGHO2_02_FULL_38_15]OGQ34493.1 MAG: hypothetical protein A3A72_05010 [Deltaproteobacteria bacterium RIFCSPLOWO2_01_FULL_38_9]OGQ60666.1 MAG: hypothetical protein A3G92_03720 [Deltaproteobacteria bacterium RIFCSPLOWO2_12_FULL_38_8]HBQ21952.1 hypothetical protein [Deltaproteobacteria bacterium]
MEASETIKFNQLEYIFAQSAKGNHILFDPDQIKKVFSQVSPIGIAPGNYLTGLNMKQLQQMKHLVDTLIHQPTLLLKQQFIRGLSEESRELIIRAYFNILENNLYANKEFVH